MKVDPPASVGVVQAAITALLSLTFSYNYLNLTSDPNTISIQPVGMCILCRTPPDTYHFISIMVCILLSYIKVNVFVWKYVFCDVYTNNAIDAIQLSRHFVLKGCGMMLFLLDTLIKMQEK